MHKALYFSKKKTIQRQIIQLKMDIACKKTFLAKKVYKRPMSLVVQGTQSRLKFYTHHIQYKG